MIFYGPQILWQYSVLGSVFPSQRYRGLIPAGEPRVHKPQLWPEKRRKINKRKRKQTKPKKNCKNINRQQQNKDEHVYYHVRNELPVYVRYRIQDAWGWCTGMIQRDDMGWEVGGGVQDWELMYTRGRFMSMYGETNTVL